eukprot:GHVR01180904.1.p1 GENE.GHVR01180904.1~~GHVR01180904.1.p1  ORF type:complete len:172 (+),score=11.72 GHVR01180904.1:1034-1549(+)
MTNMEERILNILTEQNLSMKRDMDSFKAEMLTKVGRTKMTPDEEIEELTEGQAKEELKKLSGGDSPRASDTSTSNPNSSLLKELHFLKQHNEQIDRVTIGRITVAPASIASQVGGDMTCGFMSLILEPIVPVLQSWIDGHEVSLAYRVAVLEQVQRTLRVHARQIRDHSPG